MSQMNHYCFYLNRNGKYDESFSKFLYKDDYTVYGASWRIEGSNLKIHINNLIAGSEEYKDEVLLTSLKNIEGIVDVYLEKQISL